MTAYNQKQFAPSLLWLLVMYLVTWLLLGTDPRPDDPLKALLFELRHMAIHFAGYYGFTFLFLRVYDPTSDLTAGQVWLISILLSMFIGFGQEGLQSIGRREISWLPSLFDGFIDLLGSAFAISRRLKHILKNVTIDQGTM